MMQTIPRPGSHAEETRRRILAAAKQIYEEKGTRGTTTREVAERAGVNEATLFRHFGNKIALLTAMRNHSCGLEDFHTFMDSLQDDPRADLLMIARAMVERMKMQRKLMCVSLAESALGELDLAAPEWRGPHDIHKRVTQYFADQIAQGTLRGDPAQNARAFMSLLFAYVIAEKIWVDSPGETEDLPYLVNLFLNGAQS
ncbi:MAG: TetR/AcrR family transcriptional regulator [Candidatus Velthaea sp.]|jgi:AcrR family transcriptional regulator